MPLPLKLVLISTVIAAGLFDLRYRRIPNWLNLGAITAGLAANILLFALHGFTFALLGMGCSLLIYVPLYLVRGMGAGDVKLMAAVGAIVGPWNWLGIFLCTALLGGLVSLLYVLLRRRLNQTMLNLGLIASDLLHARLPAERHASLDIRHAEALRMPHGAVIALGAMVFLGLGSKIITAVV
ncbi:MAG: prepilin peptidase [Acidobacteriaceae bacterium]|nr:prepilin peptidase [Acidobacteriaceae bacterium]